ncbi:MAG: hypothetical protein JRN20_22205, partial [Nitrososphaerota archaeon]|nr:hypothetical protein [Nitrososphaerota archaeon]
MTPSFGIVVSNAKSQSYTECYVQFNKTINDCHGLKITPSPSELNYKPLQNATVTFTITVTNSSQIGDYLFFPPDDHCRYLPIIVGSNTPIRLPILMPLFGCPSQAYPNVSLIGIQN